MKVLIFLAALLGACVASEKPASSKWDSLKVTWSINPFSSYAFATMPRDTRTDMMGFVKKDSFCNGNQPMGPYAGIRYWKGSDPAVMLIFDVNGIIAGIQTAVPKATWTPPPGPNV
uniref:Uncharacterized protein n=1 Tax=Plectus sambesii TaxID=2011161 RepID=A0A914WRS7_9BILA